MDQSWKTKLGDVDTEVWVTSDSSYHFSNQAFDGNLTTYWHSHWENPYTRDKSPAMKLTFQAPQAWIALFQIILKLKTFEQKVNQEKNVTSVLVYKRESWRNRYDNLCVYLS